MRMCPAVPRYRCRAGQAVRLVNAHYYRKSSVQHGEVDVVAVNDPFIEPKYAVRFPRSPCTLVKVICRIIAVTGLTSDRARPIC